MMNDYYWDLTLKDGRVIPIPPKGVDIVKRKLSTKEVIVTSDGVIPFSEVRGFDKTSRRKIDTKLLEEAAQAFDSPMIILLSDGTKAVKSRWIKKMITQGEYSKRYRGIPAYRNIGEEGGMVWVAFVLPVHLIDRNKHVDVTMSELKLLTKL